MQGLFAFLGLAQKVNKLCSVTVWFYSVNSVLFVANCFF